MSLVLLAYAGAGFALKAFTDFSLNDDGIYSSVMESVRTGHFIFPPNTDAICFTHLGWGALFCWLEGPSYVALHHSGLACAMICLALIYYFACKLGISRAPSALITASIAFNPIFFMLGFSYMTDVPYLTLMLAAAYLMLVTDCTAKVKGSIGLTLCSIGATLTRQCGLLIPASALAVEALRSKFAIRRMALAAIPFVVSFLTLMLLERWVMDAQHGLPVKFVPLFALMGAKKHHVAVPLAQALGRLAKVPFYLGFYLLPVGVSLFASYFQKNKARFWSIAVCAIAATVVCTLCYKPMPLCGSVFTIHGLGPYSVPAQIPSLPEWLLVALTVLCAVSGLVFLLEATDWIRRFKFKELQQSPAANVFLFLGIQSAIYTVSLITYAKFFDRYLLPLAVPCIMLVAFATARGLKIDWRPAWAVLAALVCLTGYSAFNYYSFNTAYWQLFRSALARGLDGKRIDGNYESAYLYCWTRDKVDTAPSTWCTDPQAIITSSGQPAGPYIHASSVEFARAFQSPGKIWLLEK
ncbi:MAG: hypothetical protein ACRD3W_25725 [Terriglobales bacterium]